MRLKLITVYLLVVSALALVGYISYQGLTQLMNTLQSALQPDERHEKFEQILTLITEAENNIRMFTITEDDAYLEPYDHTLNNLESHIIELYEESEGDTVIMTSLDSIFNLVQKKIYVQEELILLKQGVKMPDIYGEVLAEINFLESELNQSDTTIIEIRDSLVRKEIRKDTPPDTLENKEKKRGFFARLFGINKNQDDQDQEPQTMVSVDTIKTVDTISVQVKKPVQLSSAIERKMNRLRSREKYIQRQVAQKELELSRQDDMITAKVARVIDEVSEYLEQQAIEKASEAQGLFKRTNRYITIIGTIASMLFLIMIFIIMRDFQVILSTKRKIEEEKKRTDRLAKVKEEFLASMSHEIRTPLNAISGFANHMDDKKLSEEDRKHLKIIRNSSSHLLNIINEILDYSKLEADQLKIENTVFNAAEVLEEIHDSFNKEAKNKKLKFNIKISKKLEKYRLRSDPFRLRQIITNLISNAIKFTSKGSVTVTASLTQDQNLKLRVSDTGIGIPEDKKEFIFDKFTQADTSTTRRFGGTGLGLAIVKKLVELMGGNISLASRENKGSTFIVTIPVRVVSPGSDGQEDKPETKKLNLGRHSILIADDDEYNLLLLEKTLVKNNAIVTKVTGGKEALTEAGKNNFDLIILDLQMPDLDGFRVAQKMKAGNIQSPVIAFSAYVTDEIIEKCNKIGFETVLAKPFDESHLIKIIGNILSAGQEKDGDRPGSGLAGKMMEDDTGFMERMIHIYIKNLDNAIKELESNNAADEFEKVKYTAHKILPSTRHMGFNDLAGKLKALEDLEIKNNKAGAEELIYETLQIARSTKKSLNKVMEQVS